MKTKLKNQQGFTLIETCIALMILAVAGLGAASLFLYAAKYNSGANDRALAVAAAQTQVEQLMRVNYSDASLSAGTTNTTVTVAGHSYRINKVIAGTATLKTIRLSVTPQSAVTTWAATPVIVNAQRAATTQGQFYVL